MFVDAAAAAAHLSAAASTGTVGPDLDQADPSEALVVNRVTNGAGAILAFKDQLAPSRSGGGVYVSQSAAARRRHRVSAPATGTSGLTR